MSLFGAAEITSPEAQTEAWERHKAAERREQARRTGAVASVLELAHSSGRFWSEALGLARRAIRI